MCMNKTFVIFLASLPDDQLAEHQYPLGAGYIAAWLEERFPELDVKITASEEEIYRLAPDLLGISSVTQCYNSACEVAARVRDRLEIPVVIGGYHITALPKTLSPAFDVGVIGEGEIPMEGLIRVFLEHGGFPKAELADIPGICYRHETPEFGVLQNPPPPLLDMDLLPYPQRNISRGAKNIYMFSSRGCAYKCQFCASTRHWGRLRTQSARYFVDELKYLIEHYDATSIYLLDDLFFANKKRVAEIVELMKEEGLLGRLSFHAFITSNLASDKTFTLAKQMGFRSIRFGAETASDQLLKVMKGKWASVDSHLRCIELCHKYGFDVSAAFMLGSPGETVEDLDKTVEFLERHQDQFNINGLYFTMPMPGTPYWDMGVEKGLVSDDMDWDRLNLDFAKTASFDFDKVIYLNEENVPLGVVKQYYEQIRDRYVSVQ